jgi:Tfp pilus assembly protein PilV
VSRSNIEGQTYDQQAQSSHQDNQEITHSEKLCTSRGNTKTPLCDPSLWGVNGMQTSSADPQPRIRTCSEGSQSQDTEGIKVSPKSKADSAAHVKTNDRKDGELKTTMEGLACDTGRQFDNDPTTRMVCTG